MEIEEYPLHFSFEISFNSEQDALHCYQYLDQLDYTEIEETGKRSFVLTFQAETIDSLVKAYPLIKEKLTTIGKIT